MWTSAGYISFNHCHFYELLKTGTVMMFSTFAEKRLHRMIVDIIVHDVVT